MENTLDEQMKFIESTIIVLEKQQKINYSIQIDYQLDAYKAILQSINCYIVLLMNKNLEK